MPGAGGQIGFTEVAKAAPDGYTLGTFNLPAALALTHDRDADYDVNSYTYLANFVEDPNTITVAASSPFQTLGELLDAAKADPGAITLGLSSLGGNDHFGANMIAAASGAEFTLVPFKGASNARTAIMGGHVSGGTMTLGQTTNFPDELRVLAVLAGERSPFRPDVPTAKELGFDVQMSSLRGIVAPAGMDKAMADQLRAALTAVNENPEFQAMMAEQGNPIAFMVGDDFAATAAKQDGIAAEIWANTPWK
jgi:tripartite-type tricarboxylate transporter receptor subunit TctC